MTRHGCIMARTSLMQSAEVRESVSLRKEASLFTCCFFFQAEDGIRDLTVTGVQTCALPIFPGEAHAAEVAAIHSEVRERIAALLDPERRDRFRAFCAERDRMRPGRP